MIYGLRIKQFKTNRLIPDRLALREANGFGRRASLWNAQKASFMIHCTAWILNHACDMPIFLKGEPGRRAKIISASYSFINARRSGRDKILATCVIR